MAEETAAEKANDAAKKVETVAAEAPVEGGEEG